MEDFLNLLKECKLQLEYLNEKFGNTGTTNSLLARLNRQIGIFDTDPPIQFNEDQARELVMNYAQFVIKSMEGKIDSMPVGVWYENNKDKFKNK